MVLVLVIGLSLAAVAVTLVARALVLPRVRVTESLGQIDAYGFEARPPEAAVGDSSLRGLFDRLADTLGATVARLGWMSEDQAREQLRAAGYYQFSIRKFTGYRVLSGVLFAALWLWFATLVAWPTILTVISLPIVALTGWQFPVIFVRNRATRRLQQIDDNLPELIDLLVVTVEAGLGLNGSLQVASDRFKGPLGAELRVTLQEQRMGLTTAESLRNLLERCDTPGIRAFVRSILQGETLGISIGRVMRELAVEMRKRRRQKAEERAQKAPIKILFPLIFLIFPAMFVVLLAPAIFAFVDAI
jgi:tight adherence protein C